MRLSRPCVLLVYLSVQLFSYEYTAKVPRAYGDLPSGSTCWFRTSEKRPGRARQHMDKPAGRLTRFSRGVGKPYGGQRGINIVSATC